MTQPKTTEREIYEDRISSYLGLADCLNGHVFKGVADMDELEIGALSAYRFIKHNPHLKKEAAALKRLSEALCVLMQVDQLPDKIGEPPDAA